MWNFFYEAFNIPLQNLKYLRYLKDWNYYILLFFSQTVLSNAETNCDSKYNDNENFGSKNVYESSEDMFIEELKTQFVNSCKNIIKIHKEYTSSNPFKSIGYYAKNLYEHFRR